MKEYICKSCLFLSQIVNFISTGEECYSCCKPKHPTFFGSCNKENNWKYYIHESIYRKNEINKTECVNEIIKNLSNLKEEIEIMKQNMNKFQ
jgi:hypothetical protein